MDEYLTEMQMAKRLKVSRSVLSTLRKQGLPYRLIKRTVRYVPEEVDAWLAVHCQGKDTFKQ